MKDFSLNLEGEAGKMMPEISEPVIDEGEENKIEQPENNVEKQEVKIETIADFIQALELSYDTTEDQEMKQKIGHQIVKINMGLGVTGYSADQVKVENTPNGVLGLYYPGSNETAISTDLLEDFSADSSLIKHVLAHEEMHKKGIDDEGMVELSLIGKLPETISFYITEQQKAKSAFYNVGISKTIELYDTDKPKDLLDCYLEVELEKEYKHSKKELEKMSEKEYLDLKISKEVKDLSEKLEEGVPRFFERLNNDDIKKKVKEVLLKFRDKK